MLIATHVVPALSILVIIIAARLVCEVLWPLVFVRAAILYPISPSLFPSVSRSGDTYVLKSPDDLIDIRRAVLVQFLIVSEDDHGNVDGT